MLQTALNILIMFILTIAVMRIMGKSSIVQLTPYDLVAIFIISTIITEPLISTEMVPTIIRTLIVVVLYIILAKLTLNQKLNKFLLGEPSILIKHGKIVEDTLEKEHVSLAQLLSILRNAGYSKLTEVDFAILEPTGFVSVIPVPSSRPVTLSDIDIKGQYEGLPLALIVDGKVQKSNLRLVEQSEEWIKKKVKEKGIDDIKQVIYAFIDDQSDELYISLRENITDNLNENSTTNNNTRSGDNPPARNLTKEPLTRNNIIDVNKAITEIEKEYTLIKNSIIQLNELNHTGISNSRLKEIINRNNYKGIKTLTVKQSFIIENYEKDD